jgi:hypothetical protein
MVAHVLPGGATVDERLRRAGIAHQRAMENLAAGESALAAHESLEESPAHLANLLDRELTQLGVGLARGTTSTGEPLVYVTEILLTPPSSETEKAPANPEAQVREALRRERVRLGRRPLRSDRRLDELAAEAAQDMMRSNKLRKIDLAGIDASPRAVGFPAWAVTQRARLFTGDAFATSTPGGAARSAHLADPRLQWVGVGVAVAAERQPGAPRFWIAVICSD